VTRFTESVVEDAALAWLESIGWRVAHGPDIAPDTLGAERRDYGEVVLAQRLREALARLNPALPAEALEDAFRKLTRPVRELSQAFALAVPHEAALRIRDDLAFYDALETNDSAVKVLGDETLRAIARELVETVRNNVTIDWTLRENVCAQLRVLVKRILRKHGYPPDKQEKATQTVLEQAEVLSAEWAAA
jgi:type I site-specific restriction-modification system R (restriction) subunit